MVRPNMEEITRRMLRDVSTWPNGNHLCMKQGQPIGGNGKCGVILRVECDSKYVVRNHPFAGDMYGGPFVETFDSIDALLAAGWIVD